MDVDVVLRAQKSDAAALEQRVEQTLPFVYHSARRLCPGDADAQDVAQDTLPSLSPGLSQYQGRGSFLGWVFTRTRTAGSRHRRGHKNQPHQPIDTVDGLRSDGPDPELQTESEEIRAARQHAIDALPVEQREVIWRRDVDALSGEDAAQVLGLSLDALKSRLHRARAALRRSVLDRLDETPAAKEPVCKDVPDLVLALSRKLEGDLSPRTCAELEAHVAGCPGCQARCERLRRLLKPCSERATTAVPEALRRRIQTALWVLRPQHSRST